eukprot:c313_g1_i1 orf=273-608(-)
MEVERHRELSSLLQRRGSNENLSSFHQTIGANQRRVEFSFAHQRQPLCDITYACVSNVTEALPLANVFVVDTLASSVDKACATNHHFIKRMPLKSAHPMEQRAMDALRCMR